MVGINGVMTCFQCVFGCYEKKDTGLLVSFCQNTRVDPDVLSKFDEKFLPLKCGHFEYRDKRCSVCGQEIPQPLFVCIDDDPRNLVPICGRPSCANEVESRMYPMISYEPPDDLSQLNCVLSAVNPSCLFCGYTGKSIDGNFCSDKCAAEFKAAWSVREKHEDGVTI